MKKNNINIYDISKLAGVSIATVSRVMNNSPKVSPKTKEKVLSIISENGYTPNRFAKSLAQNSMKTIGILCSNSSDIFFADAINFISRELRKNDYDSLLYCTDYPVKKKKKYMELLLSKGVDAIILIGSDFISVTHSENEYIINASKIIPVILINGYLESENIYSVACNDKEIVKEVTKSLLNNGATDVLFVNKTLSYGSRQKLKGFKEAHKELLLPLKDWQSQIIHGEFTDVCKKFENLPKFDAVITSDDELAIAAIKFAKNNNISIPDDLQIVGYNNSKLTKYCEPELSSINNNLEVCCHSAIDILMKILNNENSPNRTIISGELIIRKTTRRI